MDWGKIVGENVRRLRKERGLTQEQLAMEAGLDLTYLGGIERGRRNPSLAVLARLAATLSISPADLLCDPSTAARLPPAQPPAR